MKKILLILVSIFTGYILTSCNGQLKAGTAALTNPLHEELVPGYKWAEHASDAAFPKE